MSRWTAFFWGAAVSTGVGVAAYIYTKRRALTSDQLVQLAKERLRQEQEEQTKRTKNLIIVGTAAIGSLYVYMQIRRLFASSSRHHHHHHHE